MHVLRRSPSISFSYRISSVRRLGQMVSLHRFYACVHDNFQSRCLSLLLAMSSRVYLFFPSCDHKPPPTPRDRLNPHLCLQRRRFLVPRLPNARPWLATQSFRSSSLPPRPLHNAPSRFPNMICFGDRPPLIRMSVPAHKSLLVRNVVSMLSNRVIARVRLYEVYRWCGLLRYAPILQSKTRWCTVELCSWRRIYVPHPYSRASITSAFIIRILRC